MKTQLNLVFILLFFTIQAKDPVDYVNPHIGGISHLLVPTYNTVHLPNSMLRFNPIKNPSISDHYVASKIYGLPVNFPGHRQKPVISIMPATGSLDVRPDEMASEYDHDFETVTPYYYAVLLEDTDIQVEFTPAEHSAMYRFIMPEPQQLHIVIRGDDRVDLRILNENTIAASELINGMRQFAYLKFNRPFESFGVFKGTEIEKNRKNIDGNQSGIYLTFNDRMIEIKYAISYISFDQAQRNLEKEILDQSFEAVKRNGRNTWNKVLDQIKITGGTEDQKTIFYTALYRTCERMVRITEDGQYYSAYDKKVHDDKRSFYVDDWSWDSYRAHHPLRLILDPVRQADIIQSYIRMYEQSGWMPSFPQAYGDMGGMIGHHQAAIIADAWFKGVREYDIDKAYQGLLKNALQGTMLPWREGPATSLDDFYREHGYFPALDPGTAEPVEDVHPFEKRQAVAVTLEHAYDDWCLAQLAGALGKEKDRDVFLKRARNYKNVYHANNGFMSPRREDGTWIEPFDPVKSEGPGCREYFAEVNSWTYSFHVQHDPAGLIALMGGAKTFTARLNRLYEEPMYGYCRWDQTADIPDGTGMVGQFVMGNEQSFHIPYLYIYAGEPWRSQKRLRMLMNTWFRNDLMGICGDEDGGAMSAWYIFSAMGFYPVTPGMPVYVIGTPLFDIISIQLTNGKNFVIKAHNNSAQNKYIQSAVLNNIPMNKAWFTHEELTNGGELILEMGPRPNTIWGTESLPPSFAFSQK
jgi:predicted alpha-1,2-mannosidase